MKSNPVGLGIRLWLADHGLSVGGLALLLLGATAWPLALPLGWTALGLAFFAWVAEADGVAVPRPGRVAIRAVGLWDTHPFAFTVRRGERVLFFVREDPERGGWPPGWPLPDVYTVRDRPNGTDFDPVFELPLGPRSEWSLRGQTPVAAPRFEHHERVSYITRSSLERSLARAGV